jgi:RNA polymerase sigma-70 factor, ECF subfamily
MKPKDEITDLLKELNNGNKEILDRLIPLVDPELKKIARAYLRNEKPGHLLQTTALVNEAMIRLLPKNFNYENRHHFYGFVAMRMRRVLVDFARKAKRNKQIGLDDVVIPIQRSEELLMLDKALIKLAEINKRQATVVDYRYFIGLSRGEIAKSLGLSESTIDREWKEARRWLKHEMAADEKN